MTTNSTFEKSFGPVGSSAGLFILVAGLIVVFYSLSAIGLIVFGAFFGFTTFSTLIDFDRKRVKCSNTIFGLIRTGKWVYLHNEMKIGVRKSGKVWRAFSRGNRTLDITSQDFRLILYDKNEKEMMPLRKYENEPAAISDLNILSKQLKLEIL